MRSTYDVRLRMHERVHVITYIVFLTFDLGERLVRTMDSLWAVGVRAYVYQGFNNAQVYERQNKLSTHNPLRSHHIH